MASSTGSPTRTTRADRLVWKPFGRSDDHLGQHLGALDHLAVVGTGQTRVGGEVIDAVGLGIEQSDAAAPAPTVSSIPVHARATNTHHPAMGPRQQTSTGADR
jgi:hypothetical protein